MIQWLKQWLVKFLNLGVSEDKDQEVNQQLFVSNLFSMIGYSITLLLSISAAFRENHVLAVSLFIAALLFFISHQIHRIKSLKNTYKISRKIILLSLLVLMLYLVYTGGHHQTGPLWIYIVPPVAFFFGGMRRGLTNIGIFIIIVAVMLFYPNDALLQVSYTYEFKSRLIYSFLTVTLLFGFYEYSRQKTYLYIQQLSQEFEKQAMHDPLTHLPNRRGMREHLEYEHKRSLRNRVDMSVLLCDIDHFKKINDQYGHETGDKVLEQLAELFTKSLRSQDKVSRWGGEEFLFLLPETNGFEAYTLAEKVRKIVKAHEFKHLDNTISLTLSIGIKEIESDLTIDKAINLADHFLYQAKENGRDMTMPCPSK